MTLVIKDYYGSYNVNLLILHKSFFEHMFDFYYIPVRYKFQRKIFAYIFIKTAPPPGNESNKSFAHIVKYCYEIYRSIISVSRQIYIYPISYFCITYNLFIVPMVNSTISSQRIAQIFNNLRIKFPNYDNIQPNKVKEVGYRGTY